MNSTHSLANPHGEHRLSSWRALVRYAWFACAVLGVIILLCVVPVYYNHFAQAIINHRFYRRKYDAEQVFARFAQSARDEVELERLTGELLNVVDQTMQPTRVSLWLKATQEKRSKV